MIFLIKGIWKIWVLLSGLITLAMVSRYGLIKLTPTISRVLSPALCGYYVPGTTQSTSNLHITIEPHTSTPPIRPRAPTITKPHSFAYGWLSKLWSLFWSNYNTAPNI